MRKKAAWRLGRSRGKKEPSGGGSAFAAEAHGNAAQILRIDRSVSLDRNRCFIGLGRDIGDVGDGKRVG